MSSFTIELGSEVEDCITGFKGRVVSRIEHITGCNQYHILNRVDSSGESKGMWVDEQRLAVTSSKPIKLDNSRTPGPSASPPSRSYPTR